MKPLVTNAANEGQVNEAEKKVKFGRDRDLSDVSAILATLHGRRFIWRYLTECRVFETSFNNSESITYFNEGMRNIGLKLLADVNEASPDAYLQMLKESKKEN